MTLETFLCHIPATESVCARPMLPSSTRQYFSATLGLNVEEVEGLRDEGFTVAVEEQEAYEGKGHPLLYSCVDSRLVLRLF